MAILEALAHKTAVLISPRCFFPEVETAGAGHIVAPPTDELEKALNVLLARPADLAEMGRAGYELVANKYSWQSVAVQLLEAYEEGIARFRATHSR